MGSRMIPLKAIMANGVEDNEYFSIRIVFEDYGLFEIFYFEKT